MRGLVVDKFSYNYNTESKNPRCAIFYLSHSGFIREDSGVFLNSNIFSHFSVPLKIAYHIRHVLEERGLIGRIKIIKC